jgi:hypothetical protein
MENEEKKLENENNGKAKQIREEMFHMVEVKQNTVEARLDQVK